jgi:hypothetical protein
MKSYWGWRYSATYSLTSALEGGEWSAPHPGRFINFLYLLNPTYRLKHLKGNRRNKFFPELTVVHFVLNPPFSHYNFILSVILSRFFRLHAVSVVEPMYVYFLDIINLKYLIRFSNLSSFRAVMLSIQEIST